MKTLKEILENTDEVKENAIAVNCAGDGKVAGIGTGSAGEPGVKKNKKPKAKRTLRGVISTVNLGGN